MSLEFEIIAHRGASSVCPENTRGSFLKALEIGVDWIEIDLRLTRDGVWVVTHDRDLSKHGGGRRKIESLSLAELRAYEYGSWFSPEFRGESLLRLEEACDLILPQSSLILDVKTRGANDFLAVRLVQILRNRPSQKILVSSFSAGFLHACRRAAPEIRLGYLMENWPLYRTRRAARERCFSIHPHRSLFARELAQLAHRDGMRVFVWTVNRPEEMEHAVREGADGIFTDFPQRAKIVKEKTVPYRNELGQPIMR